MARMAGQILVSRETNTRASRRAAERTKQGARQHPGQSNVQARGTTETATLRPAFGMGFYHLDQGAARAGMDIYPENALVHGQAQPTIENKNYHCLIRQTGVTRKL